MSAVAAAISATAVTAEPLVRVEDVHTYYGKSHILHGVSLTVAPGEVVGLLGRNGVGKSTTLKTIMGLVQPSRGAVAFGGRPITGLPPHKLARLVYLALKHGLAYVRQSQQEYEAKVREQQIKGVKRRARQLGLEVIEKPPSATAATQTAALSS